MYVVGKQILTVVNYALKCSSRLHLDESQYRAVIYLPHFCLNKAHFSNGIKHESLDPVKTPLTQLIGKDVKQKSVQVEEDEAKRTREASWRTMKFTLIGFGFTISAIGIYLIIELGKPKLDDNGLPIIDEFSSLPTWKQYIYRPISELNYYKRMIREPSREKLLPDVLKYPYYQPPYTLILELTDVLVHPDWTYKTGWRFKKRPGIQQFLESLNGVYEIVIYTAEQGMTVFPIIEALDPKNIIAYKLVRDATHFVDGHHVKDLDKLNRDLNKVIVIDWNTESVKLHPDNLFHVNRWNGEDDATLSDLAAFLRTVALSEIDNVREVLKYYSMFDNPLAAFREKQKRFIDQQKEEKDAQASQNLSFAKRWTPTFLQKPF